MIQTNEIQHSEKLMGITMTKDLNECSKTNALGRSAFQSDVNK